VLVEAHARPRDDRDPHLERGGERRAPCGRHAASERPHERAVGERRRERVARDAVAVAREPAHLAAVLRTTLRQDGPRRLEHDPSDGAARRERARRDAKAPVARERRGDRERDPETDHRVPASRDRRE